MSDRVPRLEMADLPPALAAALQSRVERLGYLGEFFKGTKKDEENRTEPEDQKI